MNLSALPHDPADETDSSATRSSETWARRLQRGDAAAVQEVRGRVARILLHGKMRIPRDERDDLEQSIVTEIWQAVNKSGFDVAGGFWAFVELVTSRRAIDWLRSRREEVELPHTLTSRRAGPLRRALGNEVAEQVERVLAAMQPACRDLIEARLRQGRSYGEIAETTGKTKGALRVQLYRCVRRARKLFRNREGIDTP